VSTPFAPAPDALALASMNAMPADAPAVKQAIELVRKRKISQATASILAMFPRQKPSG
jgi:hypothetical protein